MQCVFLQGVLQPSAATSPSPSTNCIKTRLMVTNAAPNQSTLRSSSLEGISPSMANMPPMTMSTDSPAHRKKGERQVALKDDMRKVLREGKTETYEVHWTKIPPSCMPTAPPTGAPAENVANATERACEGGNECASIPIYVLVNMIDLGGVNWNLLTDAGTKAAGPSP